MAFSWPWNVLLFDPLVFPCWVQWAKVGGELGVSCRWSSTRWDVAILVKTGSFDVVLRIDIWGTGFFFLLGQRRVDRDGERVNKRDVPHLDALLSLYLLINILVIVILVFWNKWFIIFGGVGGWVRLKARPPTSAMMLLLDGTNCQSHAVPVPMHTVLHLLFHSKWDQNLQNEHHASWN